jgi:patatin-related protein
MAEPAPAVLPVDNPSQQEIRIAVVLNGGVSLAIWMSGVVLELHHLALASQGLERASASWPVYSETLKLLDASARVDVVAGTSAGGLNGAFLALGQARRCDFALLRDVWVESGSLEKLLRPALSKNPPSPLQGDSFFLAKINAALTSMLDHKVNPPLTETPFDLPIELILTGTLWNGRTSTFTDDMGVSITERDYDATFRFANNVPDTLKNQVGDLDAQDAQPLVAQLANAARCTSSFPGAFEPHYVRTAPKLPAAAGLTASSAGQANFDKSQFVIDGGVLLNKPVRPALDAIYRQPAEKQVRRVLAYVVPDPGQPPATVGDAVALAMSKDPSTTALPGIDLTAPAPPPPAATDVVLSAMTRLQSSDSVARELAEIRDNNAAVLEQRRTRARIALAMGPHVAGSSDPSALAQALYPSYRAERRDTACQSIGALMAQGQVKQNRWSAREISDGLRRVATPAASGAAGLFQFIPPEHLDEALTTQGADWRWGQTTLVHLGDMAADVLRRALQLAKLNSPARVALIASRGQVSALQTQLAHYQRSLDEFWRSAPSTGPAKDQLPGRQTEDPQLAARGVVETGRVSGDTGIARNASAVNTDALDGWLRQVVPGWDSAPGHDDGTTRRGRQWNLALGVATALYDANTAVHDVLDAAPDADTRPDSPTAELQALYDWLLVAASDATTVLSRMLQLDIAHMATGSATGLDQLVELVQMSCGDRDRITGMQLHHFGAFYRAPWRNNDWTEGRVDGARQILRFLLAPERLRELTKNGMSVDDLLNELRKIAVQPESRHHAWLLAEWTARVKVYETELKVALADNAPATALDATAAALATPLILDALTGDLPALADQIRMEADDAAPGSRAWLALFEGALAAAPEKRLTAEALWTLYQQMSLIGNQKINDDVGSNTFAVTAAHTAVVAASTFSAPAKLGTFKPVRFVLSALRGYSAMVWAMVTLLCSGHEFGKRAVELAIAAGGVLLAITIFVPAVPVAVTLVGTGLVIAGISASALRNKEDKQATDLGLRLAQVLVIVLGALGLLIWRDIHEHGSSGAVLSTLLKFGIGLIVVLLGWYVSGVARIDRLSAVAVRVLASLALAGAAAFALRLFLFAKTFGGHADRWFGVTLLLFEGALFVMLELQLQARTRAQRAGEEWEPTWLDRGLTYGEPLVLTGAVVGTCVWLGGETHSTLATTLAYLLPVALALLIVLTVRTVQVGRWTGPAAPLSIIGAALMFVGATVVSLPIGKVNDFLFPWVWGLFVLVGMAAAMVPLLVRPQDVDAEPKI